jgi:hypothetical protein
LISNTTWISWIFDKLKVSAGTAGVNVGASVGVNVGAGVEVRVTVAICVDVAVTVGGDVGVREIGDVWVNVIIGVPVEDATHPKVCLVGNLSLLKSRISKPNKRMHRGKISNQSLRFFLGGLGSFNVFSALFAMVGSSPIPIILF